MLLATIGRVEVLRGMAGVSGDVGAVDERSEQARVRQLDGRCGPCHSCS
jgi:hypothetical protein